MKREVYLTISMLPVLLLLLIGISTGELFGILCTGFLGLLVCFLLNMVCSLLFFYHIKELDINDIIFPFVGIFTIGAKKIYYSDLGYFYCMKRKGTISVYNQKYLIFEKIFEVKEKNIENLIPEIKIGLDHKFRGKLNAKKLSDEYKNWDGYLDTKSKREDKLKNIIK